MGQIEKKPDLFLLFLRGGSFGLCKRAKLCLPDFALPRYIFNASFTTFGHVIFA